MTLLAAMLITSPFVFGEDSEIKMINEVLFHLQKKAYTAFDLRRFESAQSELLSGLSAEQQRILKSLSSYDLFVFYTICQSEAEALELTVDQKGLAKIDTEKKPWKAGFLKANIYLQTKENLFADKDRFSSWFQMLKNKYDYFKKSNSLSS